MSNRATALTGFAILAAAMAVSLWMALQRPTSAGYLFSWVPLIIGVLAVKSFSRLTHHEDGWAAERRSGTATYSVRGCRTRLEAWWFVSAFHVALVRPKVWLWQYKHRDLKRRDL